MRRTIGFAFISLFTLALPTLIGGCQPSLGNDGDGDEAGDGDGDSNGEGDDGFGGPDLQRRRSLSRRAVLLQRHLRARLHQRW
ncbi:MAG: hypothetical protein HC927_12410 [Deltaproteobacteria bacterium]|nr:hypothetical protein [Deltaproteobacteria bacterium]